MGSLMLQFQRAHAQNTGTVVGQWPKAAPPAPPTGLPTGLMAGQQLAAFCAASLAEDLHALKSVASHESRDVMKRNTLVPKYADYVRRLREAGHTHELIGYYLVWLMDAGMVEEGLDLALWCVEHGQPLPEGFKATAAYFFADTLLTWAEGQTAAGRAVQPYLDQWRAAVEAAPEAWNLPDGITARWHKVLAQQAELAGDLVAARLHYEAALALGAKCKTALDVVTRKLEKAPGAESAAPADEDITPAESDARPGAAASEAG